MKAVRYSKYTGEDLGIDAEDLLKALADFLLGSGFNNPYMPFGEVGKEFGKGAMEGKEEDDDKDKDKEGSE